MERGIGSSKVLEGLQFNWREVTGTLSLRRSHLNKDMKNVRGWARKKSGYCIQGRGAPSEKVRNGMKSDALELSGQGTSSRSH